MKKIINGLIIFLLVTSMIMCLTVTVIAESVYYYYGYQYTYINNEKVSLYGWAGEGTDITIPDYLNGRQVVEIRNYAFSENSDITSVEFTTGTNLERIGSFAFNKCINLDGEVVITENVTDIGIAAFQDCDSLDSVYLNAYIAKVPNQCFYQCETLSSVALNENITEIGSYAFAECPALAYIEIPSTVTSIAVTAFSNDTITLGVYTKSYAHQYAIDNEIPYVLLDYNERYFLQGDSDGDGKISVSDVTNVQRIVARIVEADDKMTQRSDADLNGYVRVQDATLLQRYVAHIETDTGIGVEYIEYTL